MAQPLSSSEEAACLTGTNAVLLYLGPAEVTMRILTRSTHQQQQSPHRSTGIYPPPPPRLCRMTPTASLRWHLKRRDCCKTTANKALVYFPPAPPSSTLLLPALVRSSIKKTKKKNY